MALTHPSAYSVVVSEVTSAITPPPTQLHLRRSLLKCVGGPDIGKVWQFDLDVIRIGSRPAADVTLTDSTVSRRHAEIIRTPIGVILRDGGSTNGTFVGPVRIREVFLGPETRFRVGRTDFLFTREDEVIEVAPSTEDCFEGMVGAGSLMRQVFGVLKRIAPTNLTVLITGETGTGKELASRAVHSCSKRSEKPFVVFDCGAVPKNLIESELFGHIKGSFTGAIEDRPGVFEQADGGTIFLDEIAELPMELQPKLLRVLEQREVRRVGGSQTKTVDVRVVAATNRVIKTEVEKGTFREDLYYRLAVVEVDLPPLRDRIDDIPLLIKHLLDLAEHNQGVHTINQDVVTIFESYHWPGNVRELKNIVDRALPFCVADQITIDTLPDAVRDTISRESSPPVPPTNEDSVLSFRDAKDQLIVAFERRYLQDLLERHNGNVSQAAHEAQMDRKSITRLMKKLGITRSG